jgi:hypothetical protein
MATLKANGQLTNPAMLGAGASAGLIAGFVTLFLLVHTRRQAVLPEATLAEAS